MGSVYEAQHTGTGRRVAVKVINSGDLAHDQKLVGRFQREAKAAGSIDTQHITQVLDTGVDDGGSPFLVMELLGGEDFAQLIKRLGPLPPDLALRAVTQACLGLAKAHEAQVIHRDIKPANLFLARRPSDEKPGERIVKLLDFGIAKVLQQDHQQDPTAAALTKTGSMLGSPLYISPEQAKGLKTIDQRADLWSLGVVFFQLLTAHTPYDHCDALGGLIISICHEDAASVQDLAPWVAPEVAAIVRKALTRDRDHRYQTAAEMLADLKALLPDGWAIDEAMVAPLGDAARAVVAPKLAKLAPAPPAPRTTPPPAPPAPAKSPSSPSLPPVAAVAKPPAGVAAADPALDATMLAGAPGAASPAKPARGSLLAVVILIAVGVAGGLYALRRGQAPSPPVVPAAAPSSR